MRIQPDGVARPCGDSGSSLAHWERSSGIRVGRLVGVFAVVALQPKRENDKQYGGSFYHRITRILTDYTEKMAMFYQNIKSPCG